MVVIVSTYYFTRTDLHPGVGSIEESLLGVVLGDVLEQPKEVEEEAGLVRYEEVDQDATCRRSVQWHRDTFQLALHTNLKLRPIISTFPTGNDEKLSSSQLKPGQAINSTAAYFYSISCAQDHNSCEMLLQH